MVACLEAEGAGHAAAAGFGLVEVGSELFEDFLLGFHAHDGFVVAVAVDEGVAVHHGRLEVGGVLGEEFAQQEGLAAKPLGVFVVGKQVGQLVAEDGGTAGLEARPWGRRPEWRRAGCPEMLVQPAFGGVEQAVVIERAAAAQGSAWGR